DLQAYNQLLAPLAGGEADGLSWWKDHSINSEIHPLRIFAVTVFSIVGHAGEVERTFSTSLISAQHHPRGVIFQLTHLKYLCKPQRHKSRGGWEVHPSSTCSHAHS
ncbi:hypothetical protein DFJ58DRAFT_702981, partial [Suillus subalutaceus]|uniref:uncharacterized protein n=1 Tax=Suillus subalutaceus TaxID=48586 RepID=UPI001B87E675